MQTYFVVNVDYIHAFKPEFSDGEFFNNTFFVDLNDKLGETGVLVNCPG